MAYKKNLWFTLIAVLPVLALNVSAGNIVLNENTVGAKAMPAVIEDIAGTPFKMKTDRTVTVNKGSIGADGKITEAINGLIADISKRGGGTVKVPSGHWMSGRIVLKSNVNLHLEEGAVIEFSGSIDDYQPAVFTRHEGIEIMGAGAFIYANKEKNIALTGKGTIMGPPMSASMRTLPNGKSVVENDVPHDMPVKQRICDGYEGRTFYRPKSFSPINCKNVLVEGVTFERSVLWNVNPVYCENVIIRGITVNSTACPRTTISTFRKYPLRCRMRTNRRETAWGWTTTASSITMTSSGHWTGSNRFTGKPCSCSRLVTNSGKSWKSPITTVLCRPGT